MNERHNGRCLLHLANHDWEYQGLQPIFPRLVLPHLNKESAGGHRVRKTIISRWQNITAWSNPTLVDLISRFQPQRLPMSIWFQINQTIKYPKLQKKGWLLISQHTSRFVSERLGLPNFVTPYKNEPTLKGRRIEVLPRKVSSTDTWYRVSWNFLIIGDELRKWSTSLKGKGLLPLFGGNSLN